MNRIRITDESLNSYGFWVLTSGGDLSEFERNPVLLWDHDTGRPLGILKDLRTENGEITGEPEFDMEDDFAASIARKYEKQHLRAASMGFRVLEWSEDSTYIKQGQTHATATKWKLREVSITTIGSNKNAVQLYDEKGTPITLSEGGTLPIPTITSKPQSMDIKPLAGLLKLSDTATLSDIETAVRNQGQRLADLEKQLSDHQAAQAAAQTAEAEAEITAALTDQRLTADQAATWRSMFKSNHGDTLTALKAMPVRQKLSDMTSQTPGADFKHNGKSYEDLEKENPQELARLREADPATFKALFNASRYAK